MEIIALRGDKNKGKSETLNAVYQFMLLFGYTQVSGHFKSLGAKANKDFIDIVEKKGIRVGFATMGDYDEEEEYCTSKMIVYLDKYDCDKVICACRIVETPNPVAKISAYSRHTFIDKATAATESDQRILNGEDAEKIYKLI